MITFDKLPMPLEEVNEQRVKFQQFMMEAYPNAFWSTDFVVRFGEFSTQHLEAVFMGWCLQLGVRKFERPGPCLGYVKTKTGEDGKPFVTSFSTIKEEGYSPVVLDN